MRHTLSALVDGSCNVFMAGNGSRNDFRVYVINNYKTGMKEISMAQRIDGEFIVLPLFGYGGDRDIKTVMEIAGAICMAVETGKLVPNFE